MSDTQPTIPALPRGYAPADVLYRVQLTKADLNSPGDYWPAGKPLPGVLVISEPKAPGKLMTWIISPHTGEWDANWFQRHTIARLIADLAAMTERERQAREEAEAWRNFDMSDLTRGNAAWVRLTAAIAARDAHREKGEVDPESLCDCGKIEHGRHHTDCPANATQRNRKAAKPEPRP